MFQRLSRLILPALCCAVLLAGCNPRSAEQPAARSVEEAPEPQAEEHRAAGNGGEILFLRDRSLVALNIATTDERTIADDVSDVAAAPGGRMLALVRGTGEDIELWVVERTGENLRRLTTNDQAEATPHWSPDGSSLVYTASMLPAPQPPDWFSWSAWCVAAEVRMIAATGGAEQSLGAGCEPVFSPDGKRIAFTMPPSAETPGKDGDIISANNAIMVVSRGGTERMTIVASGADGKNGYLVYSPVWSPDGTRIAYQRFLGYQSLIDINLTEEIIVGDTRPVILGMGAGWLFPPFYGPDGERMLVVGYNFSDEQGFGGYEEWEIEVLQLGKTGEVMLADGPITVHAVVANDLPRATAAAWSPDGTSLAVILPSGWHADAPAQEPVFAMSGPAELWLWRIGEQPERRLAAGLDFASPVIWLPAP